MSTMHDFLKPESYVKQSCKDLIDLVNRKAEEGLVMNIWLKRFNDSDVKFALDATESAMREMARFESYPRTEFSDAKMAFVLKGVAYYRFTVAISRI